MGLFRIAEKRFFNPNILFLRPAKRATGKFPAPRKYRLMQDQRRHYRWNQREDVSCQRKVAKAARDLMAPGGHFRKETAYNLAESLVDALVDLYTVCEGELPSFGQDRHSREVARRLDCLESAARAYRQAFEKGLSQNCEEMAEPSSDGTTR